MHDATDYPKRKMPKHSSNILPYNKAPTQKATIWECTSARAQNAVLNHRPGTIQSMESYCSGPVLFLTETCQVSACFCMHMLSMCKITVMLQIYKKPHKVGLQYAHNTRLVCTCAVERLLFPHLTEPTEFHMLHYGSNWAATGTKSTGQKKNNIVTTVILFVQSLRFQSGKERREKNMPKEIQKQFYIRLI